jgi:hypothetical protein
VTLQTCPPRKFPLVSMGGRANGQACADGERGPPSAQAEIFVETAAPYSFLVLSILIIPQPLKHRKQNIRSNLENPFPNPRIG